jgi:prevent-host-death family protein
MVFANVRRLKNKTSELLRIAARGKDVLITSHGRPVAVLHGITEDELEDYVLTHHPILKKSLEQAYREYKRKGGLTTSQVLERLGKKRARV